MKKFIIIITALLISVSAFAKEATATAQSKSLPVAISKATMQARVKLSKEMGTSTISSKVIKTKVEETKNGYEVTVTVESVEASK